MLQLHTIPTGERQCTRYAVTINGQAVTCPFARVSAMPFNTPWPGHQRDISQTEEAAFCSFEGDESVTVRIETEITIQKALVRPLSKAIVPTIESEHIVSFLLPEPGNYVLEINGMHHALHLFFNPPRDFKAEAEQDRKNGRTVYYYGPGVHEIGHVELPSHSTVTIDAGAFVYGSISAFDAEDIKINGYGVLDGSKEVRTSQTLCVPTMQSWISQENFWQNTDYPYFTKDKNKFDVFCQKNNCLNGLLRFYFCQNVVCEGVVLRDCSNFCVTPAACDHVIIDRIKTIGMWRYNTDGIDIFNAANILVKNCFLRNFDDAMVIKGIAGWDLNNNENIMVENCTIWCDWGAACEIGAETNAPAFRNITYRNCDLIHDNFGAMMRIHHHNRAEIHNITYENMHCEFCVDQMMWALQENDAQEYIDQPGTYQPYLLDLFLNKDHLYGRDDLRGNIHDIRFENIYLHIEDGVAPKPQIHMIGLSETANVNNIYLKNFFINGKKVTDISELNPIFEDFVCNVYFE